MRAVKRVLTFSMFVMLVAGLVFIISCNTIFSRGLTFETQNKEMEKVDGIDIALKLQNVYRSIAKSIMPAVVMISVESEQIVENPYREFYNDPFFRRFFGDNGMGPKEFKQKLQMLGSGFIVSKDGYIFSNYHVVRDATKVVAILSDNRHFNAKVVGTDPDTDFAILKINADNLPVVPLGDSSELEVGDLVVAVGSPYGLSGTFTTGVVSAIGREGLSSGFQRFIQTDAAINPGNSGGPLLNIKGQVVAINTAIQSQTGGFQGIGYSIPINISKSIANQILEHGKVERGYLGINITDLDSPTRKLLGLSENEGVMVSKVEKGGPADKAGIKNGDVILSINKTSVNSSARLQETVGNQPPGTVINVETLRDKKRLDFSVKLAERPNMSVRSNENNENRTQPEKSNESYDFLGATFSDAPQDVLNQNSAEYGVLVDKISDSSILSGVLSEGEIVAGINGETIKSIKDLKSFSDRNKNGKAFTFLIIQDGMMIYKGIEK